MAAMSLFPGHVLSVSELTGLVKDVVEAAFPSVWVSGEISQFTRASSGHLYFTLKDADAQVQAVMWRGVALRLKFDPRVGTEVLARGRLTVYPPKGNYQLTVEELQPKGLGAAELALRQLKEKLSAKGYFRPERKRPLPRFPRRIGLVTSPTGAAVRDVLDRFANRWSLADVVLKATRVQGDGAADEIAAAVTLFGSLHAAGVLPLDAILVARGGGSAEDLAAFNEEVVADAVFASAVPVVSAVGHEIDVSICDLVADHRAITPTAAVEAVTPDAKDLTAALIDVDGRLRAAVSARITRLRERLDHVAARPAFRQPLVRVREWEQRLDDKAARLRTAAGRNLERAKDRLAGVVGRLDSLSPLAVLTRGYSLTFRDGHLVRDAATLSPGETITSRLARGRVASTITATDLS
jgi:exodeoxyribonuclease VII large subunit